MPRTKKRAMKVPYSEGTVNRICEAIADGKSLSEVCKRKDIPHICTVLTWLANPDKAEFKKKYDVAVASRTKLMFDDLIEIADKGEDVNRDRLRVDTRKWYLAKCLPKVYGDKGQETDKNVQVQVNVLNIDDKQLSEALSEKLNR